jgi:phospholipid-transporting ATPase
MSVIV